MPHLAIYPIEATNKQMIGSELSLKGNSLTDLFYNMKYAKINLSKSATLEVNVCLIL